MGLFSVCHTFSQSISIFSNFTLHFSIEWCSTYPFLRSSAYISLWVTTVKLTRAFILLKKTVLFDLPCMSKWEIQGNTLEIYFVWGSLLHIFVYSSIIWPYVYIPSLSRLLGAIHQGRPADPGEGKSRKTQKNRTPIVIFNEILLLNPDRRGRGGLKIQIFAGRP